ncbi:MAG: anti-sigma factor antagonist [Deltaproteobacteria bacterium HGW-Deltaproteobacteria-1]|jgi:anti-anti-sigma factor|nr:MAG: anti-sigma factor antagonist [Deltaproteobacteria bacterium HGW-Deltaproteobacteria-1]
MALIMNVESKLPGSYFVTLSGRLDGTTSPDCDARISSILIPSTKTILFEMTNLDYISSMGLRIFLKAKRMIEQQDGHVYMINVQPQIEKVFEIANMLNGIRLFASISEADAYFDAMQKSVLESLNS